MSRPKAILIAVAVAAAALLFLFSESLAFNRAHAQAPAAIEDELILIPPVAKTLADPAPQDFARWARSSPSSPRSRRRPRPSSSPPAATR